MQKILVIRFSSIGDIVLTSAAVRVLSAQLNAEIHFLTKKEFVSLVNLSPYIQKVIEFDGDLWRTIQKLREENYDCIIDLHHNLRTSIIKFLLQKKSYSFQKLNVEKWLLTTFKKDILPDKHLVDRYIECCEPLGVKNDFKGLDFFYEKENDSVVKQLPISFHQGYFCWVIGAKQATKKFPVSKIISLLNHQSIKEIPVILIGGKEDRAEAELILEKCNHSSIIYNACGEGNIAYSAAYLQQAKFVVSNDTGMMHIAAALKKPIISIWGNTVPKFGMTPYYPEKKSNSFISEVANLSCRPCSKLGYANCPINHFKCMINQDEEKLTQKIVEFWNLAN